MDLFRHTTLGKCLLDALAQLNEEHRQALGIQSDVDASEMVHGGAISDHLAKVIMSTFEKSMTDALDHLPANPSVKIVGRQRSFNNIDNIWRFKVDLLKFNMHATQKPPDATKVNVVLVQSSR